MVEDNFPICILAELFHLKETYQKKNLEIKPLKFEDETIEFNKKTKALITSHN